MINRQVAALALDHDRTVANELRSHPLVKSSGMRIGFSLKRDETQRTCAPLSLAEEAATHALPIAEGHTQRCSSQRTSPRCINAEKPRMPRSSRAAKVSCLAMKLGLIVRTGRHCSIQRPG